MERTILSIEIECDRGQTEGNRRAARKLLWCNDGATDCANARDVYSRNFASSAEQDLE